MKIINFYEQEGEVGNKKVIYKGAIIKESLISSILSDTYTFGTLLLSFYISQTYVHSKLLDGILLICFLLQLSSAKKKRVTKEEFKKIMNEYLESEE